MKKTERCLFSNIRMFSNLAALLPGAEIELADVGTDPGMVTGTRRMT